MMTLAFGLELSMSALSRDTARPTPIIGAATWQEWWSWTLGLSLFSGILITVLGDAFFRVRIALAGARISDDRRVARVYLSLVQIGAVPAILCRIAETCYFATPAEASAFPIPAVLIGLVFGVWGQVGEYQATVTVFGARPWAARFVFFWIPILGVIFVGVLVAELLP